MSELSYRIICGIAVLITVVSVCSSIYILTSWWKLKKRKHNDLLNDYVAYMSVFDLLMISLRGTYLLNPTFKWSFISNAPSTLCKILGAYHQFTAICGTTWNFIIAAFILLPIIIGTSMFKITKQKYCHFIFISVVTFIFVLIPIINNGYGLTDNASTRYGLSKYECWIEKKEDFICLYGPITFYVIFSIILLIWSILCKFKGNQIMSQLRSQLIWYTLVFIFVWAPPIINRFYSSFTNKTSFILVYMETLSLHSVGWANASVWFHYMKPLNLDQDDHLLQNVHINE